MNAGITGAFSQGAKAYASQKMRMQAEQQKLIMRERAELEKQARETEVLSVIREQVSPSWVDPHSVRPLHASEVPQGASHAYVYADATTIPTTINTKTLVFSGIGALIGVSIAMPIVSQTLNMVASFNLVGAFVSLLPLMILAVIFGSPVAVSIRKNRRLKAAAIEQIQKTNKAMDASYESYRAAFAAHERKEQEFYRWRQFAAPLVKVAITGAYARFARHVEAEEAERIRSIHQNVSAQYQIAVHPEPPKPAHMQERILRAFYENGFISVHSRQPEQGTYILRFVSPKDGTTDEQITAMASAFNAALGTYEVENHDLDARAGVVDLRVWTVQPKTQLDRILALPHMGGFFKQNPCLVDNPAEDVFNIPLGLTADGGVYKLALHHTIVGGRTGSGKGSVIQGIIRQYAPLVARGFVRMWIIDPKNAEAIGYGKTSIFHRIATDPDDIITVIQEFTASMNQAKTNSGRKNPVTESSPLNLLIIDEFPSVKDDKSVMGAKDGQGRTVESLFNSVIKQGRSLNHFVVAATQEVTEAAFGSFRKNMPSKIALQIESDYEAALMLGVEQVELYGNKQIIHPIPASNQSNGYRYSGIANVRAETGEITAVRIAYTSDAEIDELQEEYRI